MAQKPKILNEAPNRELLELKEEEISLRTHDARLHLTELTMLAALSREISAQDAKLIYHAIELASKLEDRVQKSETVVTNILLKLGESTESTENESIRVEEFEVVQ